MTGVLGLQPRADSGDREGSVGFTWRGLKIKLRGLVLLPAKRDHCNFKVGAWRV